MDKRTLLEEAAYNYAHQLQEYESADNCAAPARILDALWAGVNSAKEILNLTAIDYYESVYDGAPLY